MIRSSTVMDPKTCRPTLQNSPSKLISLEAPETPPKSPETPPETSKNHLKPSFSKHETKVSRPSDVFMAMFSWPGAWRTRWWSRCEAPNDDPRNDLHPPGAAKALQAKTKSVGKEAFGNEKRLACLASDLRKGLEWSGKDLVRYGPFAWWVLRVWSNQIRRRKAVARPPHQQIRHIVCW